MLQRFLASLLQIWTYLKSVYQTVNTWFISQDLTQKVAQSVFIIAFLLIIAFFFPWGFHGRGLTYNEKITYWLAVKNAIVTSIGGLVTAMGLFQAYQQFILSKEEQIISKEEQLTTRFSTAVELLGHEDTSVRLGALYSLESIANDSDKYYSKIIETIGAYIRSHANLNLHPLQQSSNQQEQRMREDINAAVNIIGSRKYPLTKPSLSNCNLTGLVLLTEKTDFSDFHFENVVFNFAKLDSVSFSNSEFSNCSFKKSKLSNCNFTKCQLNSNDFANSDITDCNFSQANLDKSQFDYSEFTKCNFYRSSLYEANFKNTTLHSSEFEDVTAREIDFSDAEINGGSFSDSYLRKACFKNAKLYYSVRLRNCDLRRANFNSVNFTQTILEGSDCNDTSFEAAEFYSPNLLNVENLEWEQLQPINYFSNTALPTYLMEDQPDWYLKRK